MHVFINIACYSIQSVSITITLFYVVVRQLLCKQMT